MSLYFINKSLHSKLSPLKEFRRKVNRAYYLVRLNYQESTKLFGIPLVSNIDKKFFKENNFVETPPTATTKEGNKAGWLIAKMVPLDGKCIRKAPPYNNLVANEQIAEDNRGFIQRKAQKIIDDYFNGKKAFGMVDLKTTNRILDDELSLPQYRKGSTTSPMTAYQDLSSASQPDLSGYVGKESAAVISKETHQELHNTQNKNQPQQVRQVGQVEQVGLVGQVGQAQKSQNNVKQKAKAPNSAGKR